MALEVASVGPAVLKSTTSTLMARFVPAFLKYGQDHSALLEVSLTSKPQLFVVDTTTKTAMSGRMEIGKKEALWK